MTTDNQIPFHWKCPVTCLSVDKLVPSGSIDTYWGHYKVCFFTSKPGTFHLKRQMIFNEIEIKSHYEIASHSWTWWDILKFSDILGQDYVFYCSFNRPEFRFRGDSETTKELRLARISLCIVWLFIFCHVWKLIPTVYETFFMDVSVNSTTDDWPGRSSKQPKRSDREGQWMPPPITTFGLWVIIIKPKQHKNTIKVCVVLWPHLTVSHFSVVPEIQRTILYMIVRLRDLERRHISSKSHSRVQD